MGVTLAESEKLYLQNHEYLPIGSEISVGSVGFLRAIEGMQLEQVVVMDKEPEWQDRFGWVYKSAPSLTGSFAQRYFEQTNEVMTERRIERGNSPVVWLGFNQENGIGVSIFDDRERLQKIPGELRYGNPHIYTVARLSDPQDIQDLCIYGNNLKRNMGTQTQTLIATYMPGSRQDKNVSSSTGEYNGDFINIQTFMEMLSQSFDRIYVVEPHSSATQYHAAISADPSIVVPISPWEYMLTYASHEGIDLNGRRVLGPDAGRNIISRRIAKYLDTEPLTLDKKRIDPRHTLLNGIPQELIAELKGGEFLAYDDEINSGGTIKMIIDLLERAQASDLNVFCVHSKFTGDFCSNLQGDILTRIWTTDSREPIGNLQQLGKCRVISLIPWLRIILNADQKPDFNPWTDTRFKDAVIQETA